MTPPAQTWFTDLAQAVTVFGPMLTNAGVSEGVLRRPLVGNSRRFLAFRPKNG